MELKSDSHLQKNFWVICFIEKLFKNDEKCFLFHLKIIFRSQDIKVFSQFFGYVEKTA